MSIEDKLLEAVVNQFFESKPAGTDTNGNVIFQESHVANVARQFFASHREELYEKITARLTIDAIAEKAAQIVLSELEKKTDSYWSYDASNGIKASLSKAVRNILADKIAARELAKMDAGADEVNEEHAK
jgi:hypothetical protein